MNTKLNEYKYFQLFFRLPPRTKVSLYESRNAACKKAKGEFIAFLDVDDIWFSNKLKLQLSKFKDKKVGLVYGKFFKINNENFLKKKQLITK